MSQGSEHDVEALVYFFRVNWYISQELVCFPMAIPSRVLTQMKT